MGDDPGTRGATTMVCRGVIREYYVQGNRKSGMDAGSRQLTMASAS
jgi:hypothetical protein